MFLLPRFNDVFGRLFHPLHVVRLLAAGHHVVNNASSEDGTGTEI